MAYCAIMCAPRFDPRAGLAMYFRKKTSAGRAYRNRSHPLLAFVG
jgi:hypothetical protein